MRAWLVLEDGFALPGESFTGEGEACGEIVFNTSMTGYQEILTDPSYAGQMITFTYPLIGNYGVNGADEESDRLYAEAVVLREYTERPSSWRAEESLAAWLSRHGRVGVHRIDTRALTRHIRSAGAMRAVVSTREEDPQKLAERARSLPSLVGADLAREVTCTAPYQLPPAAAENETHGSRESAPHVVVVDFGVKRNILRSLTERGCRVTVVPATTPAVEVLAAGPDGVLRSNGPGDPAAVGYGEALVGELLGRVPLFGICLGHQLLGRALGLPTYKLKFGHRGANHPVKDLRTGRVEITSQNHGFAVALPGGEVLDRASPGPVAQEIELPRGGGRARLEVSHVSLYDGTIEGFALPELAAFSLQYHPEASPGPHDAHSHFERFLEMIRVHAEAN